MAAAGARTSNLKHITKYFLKRQIELWVILHLIKTQQGEDFMQFIEILQSVVLWTMKLRRTCRIQIQFLYKKGPKSSCFWKSLKLQSFLSVTRLTKAVQLRGPHINNKNQAQMRNTNSPREYKQHFRFVKEFFLQLWKLPARINSLKHRGGRKNVAVMDNPVHGCFPSSTSNLLRIQQKEVRLSACVNSKALLLLSQWLENFLISWNQRQYLIRLQFFLVLIN